MWRHGDDCRTDVVHGRSLKMIKQPLATFHELGSAVSRPIVFVAAAWRAATWKHLLYTSLLCLAWSGAIIATQTAYFAESVPLRPALNAILTMQFNGFAVLLGVLIADRASPLPLRRWGPYVLAVLVGVTVGSSLLWLVSQRLLGITSAYQTGGMPEGYDTFFFRHAVHGLVYCGLATCVYVCRRWAAHRLTALRVVQLQRSETEKRVLEARLATMQARVEPQFLWNTLSQVERLYESDAPAADRMLKELTTYLRAAIPQTRDPSSTVGREIQLTNAFLNIVDLRLKDRLVRSHTGTAIEDAARMPPMVLLPLINRALARRVEPAQGDEWFGIDVAVSDGRLRLTIRDKGTGFASTGPDDTEIRHIRERLAVLYGENKQLTLKETLGGSEAVIEIPYKFVPDLA